MRLNIHKYLISYWLDCKTSVMMYMRYGICFVRLIW